MQIRLVSPREDFNAFLKKETGYQSEAADEYIESRYIAEISEEQAVVIEKASQEMYTMCLAAVDNVIKEERFEEFGIGELQAEHIKASWQRRPAWGDGSTRDPELFSRFDLRWDGDKSIKFYEINGDTPTTAFETGPVQLAILQDLKDRNQIPQYMVQRNTLEEKTVDRLRHIFNMASKKITDTLHLTADGDFGEDSAAIGYMEGWARQAGWKTQSVDVKDIGANEDENSPHYGSLYDADDNKIEALYKLVPWDNIYDGNYAQYVARDEIMMLEPAWKAVLSNKMLSVVLWEMYPNHPYLLPAYARPEPLGNTYVEKPIFGRQSADVKIVQNGKVISESSKDQNLPDYADSPKIYQQFCPLPEMPELPGWKYKLSAWIVGDGDFGGIGIEMDKSLVTNTKDLRFVPHVVRPKQKFEL